MPAQQGAVALQDDNKHLQSALIGVTEGGDEGIVDGCKVGDMDGDGGVDGLIEGLHDW